MRDGERVPCEVVLSHFGYKLNDSFLNGLDLNPKNALSRGMDD